MKFSQASSQTTELAPLTIIDNINLNKCDTNGGDRTPDRLSDITMKEKIDKEPIDETGVNLESAKRLVTGTANAKAQNPLPS